MISFIYEKIKKAAFRAGFLYLCLTAVLMLFGEAMAHGERYYFDYGVVMRMTAFSLVFGGASLLFEIRAWNRALPVVLHLALNLVSYYYFILKPLPLLTPAGRFVQLTVFVLLYLTLFFIGQLAKWIAKRIEGGRRA